MKLEKVQFFWVLKLKWINNLFSKKKKKKKKNKRI